MKDLKKDSIKHNSTLYIDPMSIICEWNGERKETNKQTNQKKNSRKTNENKKIQRKSHLSSNSHSFKCSKQSENKPLHFDVQCTQTSSYFSFFFIRLSILTIITTANTPILHHSSNIPISFVQFSFSSYFTFCF